MYIPTRNDIEDHNKTNFFLIGGRKDMKSRLSAKFGFILLITCLLVFGCSTPILRFDQLTKDDLDKIAGKDWHFFYVKEFGKGESPTYYYYHRASLSYPSEKIVRVWRKQIFMGGRGYHSFFELFI